MDNLDQKFNDGMKKLEDIGRFDNPGEKSQRTKEYYHEKMKGIQKELRHITEQKNKINRK